MAIDDARDDQSLVAAAQAGDRHALDLLLRRHIDRVSALCRRIAGNDADGADATQEALIAIVKGLPRFDGRSKFSTWAWRVATNACLDELRRRKRRPEPAEPAELGDFAPVGGPSIAGAVADRLDVDAALAQLPTDFRAAVVLRDLCGLEYAEIAEVLSIPVGTVRSRIARGRAALVPILGNREAPQERPSS
ncbi:MAG: RNA polymerase sigma factor [Acidimicrobiales bacterium]